jgi:hypothetical protein
MIEKLNTRQYVKKLVELHGPYAPIPVYVLTLGELDELLDIIPEIQAEAPEISELVTEPYNPKFHADAPHPDICTTDTMQAEGGARFTITGREVAELPDGHLESDYDDRNGDGFPY